MCATNYAFHNICGIALRHDITPPKLDLRMIIPLDYWQSMGKKAVVRPAHGSPLIYRFLNPTASLLASSVGGKLWNSIL